MSGFSDQNKVNLLDDKLHEQRLQKPVSSKNLLQGIRHALDGSEFI